MIDKDCRFMEMAIAEAECAEREAEVPVGAVLVSDDGLVLCRAHNQTVGLTDPTAHAEVLCLRAAARKLANYRLLNTCLYVTIEPCIMCMGALVNARVARLVFGAVDPKWGAAGSLYDFSADERLNHRVAVHGGVCEARCRRLMQDFFRTKR